MLPPAALVSVLLGLRVLCAASADDVTCLSAPPVNAPIDRDANGRPDWVRVGDFDGDGALEIDDIQDAMDALTDPGPKLILVEPGRFAPPADPSSRAGRHDGLLELRSFTTLQCAGVGRTVLQGSRLGAGQDYAVVVNADRAHGDEEVWVRGCEIDGGAPATYDSRTFPGSQRMGVYFWRTRNSGVADSHVHDTVHAGLYSSNSSGDQFLRNLVERAGGHGDTSRTWRQPCIYLYAYGGGNVLRDFRAIGNTLRRCGHSGLNTRAQHTDRPGDVVRNVLWEGNSVEDAEACIGVRGVDGLTVRDLTCRRTGPIRLTRGFGRGYRFQGNDNANSNVVIEHVFAADVSGGLDVGAWVDGLTLRHLRVEGTRDGTGRALNRDCARLDRPLRAAVIEHVVLRDCGRRGAVVTTQVAGRGDASETLTLRRVEVAAVDRARPRDAIFPPAIEFVGDHSRLLLEDLKLSAARGPGLRFGGALAEATLRRIDVDSTAAAASFARGARRVNVVVQDVTIRNAGAAGR